MLGMNGMITFSILFYSLWKHCQTKNRLFESKIDNTYPQTRNQKKKKKMWMPLKVDMSNARIRKVKITSEGIPLKIRAYLGDMMDDVMMLKMLKSLANENASDNET